MKRLLRNTRSLLLALTLVLSLSVTAFAADSTITFSDKDTEVGFAPGSGYTATDLFDGFKDVMPGDKLTETVTVKNQVKNHDYIKVYLRAIPHDEQNNPLTYSEAFENADGKDQSNVDGMRDESVATQADFLAQLTMRVYDKNGNKIFEASPDELNGLKENVYLGSLDRNKSMDLTVELEVPITLGNEFANRVGEVDWVFTVEAFNKPSDTPQTGDYAIMAAFAAMAVSGTALVLLLLLKRRKSSR